MGTGIKLPSQAVFILYKLFLGLALWLSSTGTKNVGLRIPSLCVQALEMALRKDYETTSPRIYVNRRTPSCPILKFPVSNVQDRSATLQYPSKVLRSCHKHWAV